MRTLVILGAVAAAASAAIYAFTAPIEKNGAVSSVRAAAPPVADAPPIAAPEAGARGAEPGATEMSRPAKPARAAEEERDEAPPPPAYYDALIGAPPADGVLVDFFDLDDEKLKDLPLPEEIDWSYMRGLHAWMAREERDAAWAAKMEAFLNNTFNRQPFSGPGVHLNIECRKTLCRAMAVADKTVVQDGKFGDGGWQDLAMQAMREGVEAKLFNPAGSLVMMGPSAEFPDKRGMIAYFGRTSEAKPGD